MAVDVAPAHHSFGLECWGGEPPTMPVAHRHEHLEVNLVLSGGVVYQLGGRRFEIRPGTLAVFWASIPHQIIDSRAATRMHWLHLPIGQALSWALPARMLGLLLSGRPLLAPIDTTPLADERSFLRWASDLHDPELLDIALLEMEAMIRRVSHHVLRHGVDASEADDDPVTLSRAVTMAQFIATECRRRISVADVAASTHLSPHYAMTLFRRVIGQTIGDYLTACRVAEAQRLLLTTDAGVAEIAHAAGFGSSSRFYASFAENGLPPPSTYRRRHARAGFRVEDGGPETGRGRGNAGPA